ncbi:MULTISPECIES: DUF397 domain-containing protein [Streptomyces]|uniref:DUF397 domain-containing protein n=1 Tax=Streptomyces TaxID=1883 RepID=UPI000DFC10F6|nr:MULTISPECIES: DUF397 domain-containing protein [Streptomyces]MBT3076683.1 DUF397 domain-containing protein [Streptomyces sp. COG21]MBT3078799.1 DUF397 domain-containing protein [Streptomyces sp. COG20]MBT3089743.1 DUF397 domain-containing protein [Streptomyces sp. CYG21]MBT3095777.1 DUF397 domain-containing protein [Streptomyces sp. CBG30]MBT3107336.1 DUF397 domain-containing protein [Streptomyces sp. COG19]
MEIQWRKSSGAEGNAYVELAEQGDEILLRESGKLDVVVRMTRSKLEAFLGGAKGGELDDLA